MTYFARLAAVLAALDPSPLLPFVRDCAGTLWLCGNGGSHAIAQHWACDLSKAAGRLAQALGCNPSVLTAWANDTEYALVFVAELHRIVRPNDRLVVLSCSGTSPNILRVLTEAVTWGIPAALITSDLCPADSAALIRIPSDDYGVIEDCMSAIGHWLTEALR